VVSLRATLVILSPALSDSEFQLLTAHAALFLGSSEQLLSSVAGRVPPRARAVRPPRPQVGFRNGSLHHKGFEAQASSVRISSLAAAMSYYDIDAILTDAEKVPCQFELDIPDLGHLDNSPSLKAGTQILLPLWLAETLAVASLGGPTQLSAGSSQSRNPVTLNLPPALRQEVLSALKADARSVPLRDQSAHFFALGTRMLELFDEAEVAEVLRKSFVARAGEVQLHARLAGDDTAGGGAGGGTGEEFLRSLDEWERALFRRAHEGVKGGKEFMEGVKKH
jgi:GINS complex subunit 3